MIIYPIVVGDYPLVLIIIRLALGTWNNTAHVHSEKWPLPRSCSYFARSILWWHWGCTRPESWRPSDGVDAVNDDQQAGWVMFNLYDEVHTLKPQKWWNFLEPFKCISLQDLKYEPCQKYATQKNSLSFSMLNLLYDHPVLSILTNWPRRCGKPSQLPGCVLWSLSSCYRKVRIAWINALQEFRMSLFKAFCFGNMTREENHWTHHQPSLSRLSTIRKHLLIIAITLPVN